MNVLKKILPLMIVFGLSIGYSHGQDFIKFNTDVSNQISLYPNPAVDFLTIEIKESNLVKPFILVHSIIGGSIKIETEKISKDKYRIGVKDLPNGYYLISVKDPGTNFNRTYKFLKK